MKTDILNEEIFADASSLKNVGTQEGKELSGLVGQLNGVMEQINDTEEHLKQLKAEKVVEGVKLTREAMLAKFRTGMGLPDAPVQTELTGERFINELLLIK